MVCGEDLFRKDIAIELLENDESLQSTVGEICKFFLDRKLTGNKTIRNKCGFRPFEEIFTSYEFGKDSDHSRSGRNRVKNDLKKLGGTNVEKIYSRLNLQDELDTLKEKGELEGIKRPKDVLSMGKWVGSGAFTFMNGGDQICGVLTSMKL